MAALADTALTTLRTDAADPPNAVAPQDRRWPSARRSAWARIAAVSRRRARARGCETVRERVLGSVERWHAAGRGAGGVRARCAARAELVAALNGRTELPRSRSARPSALRARRVRGWRRTGTGMPMGRSGASSGPRPSRAGASPR
jgi:hypothetical protein